MITAFKRMGKQKILSYLEILIYLVCFFGMCISLCCGTEAMYQTFRDFFNYQAISFFLVILIVVRRAKVWRPISLVCLSVYGIGAIWFLYSNLGNGVEYLLAIFSKIVAYGCFVLLVCDFFVSGNIVKWKERNKILTVMLLVAIILSLIISPGRASLIYFLCPFTALYFIRITAAKWKQLMLCLSISLWFSNVVIMVISLIKVPYEGGRYVGIFLNQPTIGIFCATAAISALYWFLLIQGKSKISKCLKVLSIFAFIISLAFTALITVRVAYLAVIMAFGGGFAFWYLRIKDKNSNSRKILKIGIGSIVVVLILGICVLISLYAVDIEEIEDNISSAFISSQLLYWKGKITHTIDAESKLFESGSVLAMLDNFLSYRVYIWSCYIKEISVFGNSGLSLPCTEMVLVHPHNNFLAWLYRYGLLGGGTFIVWFISLLVHMIKKTYSTKKIKYLFPLLCGIIAFVSMLTESILRVYLPAFLVLLVQYVFIIDIPEENETTNVCTEENKQDIKG